MNVITKTVSLPDGRTISIETGKVAKQADGSCVLRMGNTVLLATVCAAKDAVPGTDFMPLQVEYKEKYSAFGRFPGGFTKREGKASDYEILTCRLVDRALRPLFPDNFHAEVYVNIILYSADGVDMPDALAGLAASAALAVSDIPFGGPISEVRVARIDGQFVINPTFEQLEKADMDLMVAATYENIMMVEGEMNEVSEQDLLEALKAAHEAIKIHCKAQMELMEEVGSTVKREYCHEENDEDLRKAVHDACYEKAYAIAASGNRNKHERQDAFDAICEEFKAQFTEEELEEKAGMTVSEIFEKYGEEKFRDMEHDACVELAGLEGLVIASGGGAFTFKRNVEAFKGKDKIVFLDVPLGIIKSRLKNDTTRPLLQRPDRDRVMKDLYDSRYPIYHAAADIVVKGKNTPLKTAFAIIDAVSGTDVAEKPHKNA